MIKAILFLIELKWLDLNRKGKFKIVSSDGSCACFVTNFGRFTIDRSRSAIVISGIMRNQEIPFGDVARLDHGRIERSAVLEEIAIGGLDLEHDVIEWYTVDLILRDGSVVPIYAIGEYRIRVPWGQWIMDMERKLFLMIGLRKDGFEASSAVAAWVQKLFTDAGQHYPIKRHGAPPPVPL